MDNQGAGHGYIWADEINQEQAQEPEDNFDDLINWLDMVSLLYHLSMVSRMKPRHRSMYLNPLRSTNHIFQAPATPAEAPQSFAAVTSPMSTSILPPPPPQNLVTTGALVARPSTFLGAANSLDAQDPPGRSGLNSGPNSPAIIGGLPHVFYPHPHPPPYPYPHPHHPPPHGYLGASGVAQPHTTVISHHLQPVYAQNMAYNYPGQVPAADLAHAGLYKADSYSPEPGAEGATQSRADNRPQHRRGYQACQRCRERKVKCDLGSK